MGLRFAIQIVFWGLMLNGAIGSEQRPPILTGLSRRDGIERAYFFSADRDVAFSLTKKGSWAGYELISVDFKNRTVVLEEAGHRFVARFGGGSDEVTSPAPKNEPEEKVAVTSPFSPSDELFRTRYGWDAYAKLEKDRLIARQKAEREAAKLGISISEIVISDPPPPELPEVDTESNGAQ